MTFRLTLLLPVLLLAACEKTPNPVQSGKSAAASASSQQRPVITALLPGLWETTTEIAVLDPEARKLLTGKDTQALADELGGRKETSAMCLSPDQARSPNATVIGGSQMGECSFESFSLHRGTMDAVLICSRPGKPGRTLIAAHGTYEGKAFALDTVMRIEPDTPYDTVKGPMPTASSPPVRFHTRITGAHKGECPAGADVAQ